MKKLPLPEVDDLDILETMKNSPGIACQPFITNEYDQMRLQYTRYANNDGNPWACVGGTISNDLTNKLEYHYKSPYSDLQYIKELRAKGSPDVCPFCGSLKTATLDHFLPQADYPEWIIYSRNLVPACDCNSKRRNDVKGELQNQRVLHPYYDNCLTSRIISTEYSGNYEEPVINIVPLPVEGTAEETISFHIDTVVKRSTAIHWMEEKWQSMRRNPRVIISSIPRTAANLTIDELDTYLLETLEDKDEEHQTPNNWYSIFIHGIYRSEDVKAWLVHRFNGIKSGAIDPLV